MLPALPRTGNSVTRLITSTELALALFGALALVAIPGTFGERRGYYSSVPVLALLVTLGISTLACTVRRWKTMPVAVITIHCGIIVLLGGALLGTRGFVATVNVYEGDTVDRFYRSDLDRDLPLGVALTVQKIEAEPYAIPVQVGVMKGDAKHRLFTLKTGESFELDTYRVRADSLDLPAKRLELSIMRDGRTIGRADTSGAGSLPPDFPYQFRLVAYRNPVVKRIWTDLVLSREGHEVAAGRSSINNPFQWEGLSFYNTQLDNDANGRIYAGIQVVHDPGRPIVFAGLSLLAVGAVLSFARRLYGWRR